MDDEIHVFGAIDNTFDRATEFLSDEESGHDYANDLLRDEGLIL